MHPAFKIALYLAAGLLVLVGIVVAVELQLSDQRRMIDAVRADQIRALNPRKVRQMIDEAMRPPQHMPQRGHVQYGS